MEIDTGTPEEGDAFYLESLILENYRCFGRIDLTLDRYLTVLVAPNGGGKTALLDAIAISFRLFVDTVEGRKTSKGFDSSDIRLVKSPNGLMEQVTPVSLGARGVAQGKKIVWARERHSEVASRTTTANAFLLKDAAIKMSFLNQKFSKIKDMTYGEIKDLQMNPTYPLIAYYGTGRLWGVSKLLEQKRIKLSAPNARYRGYTDCLSSSSHYKYFIDWFRRYSYSQRKNENADQGDDAEPTSVLEAVCHAVDIALKPTGWGALEWDFKEDIIIASHPDFGSLPVDFLSDGIRNVIGLVADIAHRMARLNPHLGKDVARSTGGIALIDEVDMHLHPKWQQEIMASLRSAFPKIQFIVSTHSPQVLSTVRKENIRILSERVNGEWDAEQPSHSPLAQESTTPLAEIMNTEPRAYIPGVVEDLRRYQELVRSGFGNSSNAREVLESLTRQGFEFGEADTALFKFLNKQAQADD